MNDELLQDSRVTSLTTPLGPNKLALTRFEGYEGLSELFEFRIEALSKESDIDFNKALGQSCTVKVATTADPKRFFDGVLVEAQTLGMVQDLYSYRLVLRPQLWLLSRTANCRIWHEKTALDIIKQVLGDRGVTFRTATTRTCRKREYCVQYRETDLDFICRLMEDEGIYYFFEHEQGKHTTVLADAPSSHKPIAGHEKLRFSTVSAAGYVREEALFDWTAERRFRSGKFELRDYNFKTPGNKLVGPAKAQSSYTKSDLEIYDYPGKYEKESEGKSYAEIRRDAEQALDWRRYGSGEAPSLFPGGHVTVTDHPQSSENLLYLVVRATHQFSSQTYRSSGAFGGGDDKYRGNYEFLPASKNYRAPIVTPKPLVHGPQTAKVVGEPGDEIFTDEHGRIKVSFHWDRADNPKSCWIRVAQMWAGNTWGGQFIPRVGMEVVVEFLEGDPDRPLVVGAVYNNDNKYPWTLPANKTQSGIKSDSSKGHNGYNQVRLEDKKGSEEINVRAEKDLNSVIVHAETRKIGERFDMGPGSPARETTIVIGDDKLAIKGGNRDTSIAMDDTLDVKLRRETKIGFSDTLEVKGMSMEDVKMLKSLSVGGPLMINSKTMITLSVGATTVMITSVGVLINGQMIGAAASSAMLLASPAIAAAKIYGVGLVVPAP